MDLLIETLSFWLLTADNAELIQLNMNSTGVQVIDLRECTTPELLAQAISESLSTAGFLFIQGHGLEGQVEELFEISGEYPICCIRRRAEADVLTSVFAENFFANETEEEKQKAAYVSQHVALYSGFARSIW
jgi:hypothetical protein